MPTYIEVMVGSWIVFMVIWLVGMATAKRTARRPWYQGWAVRVAILVAVFLITRYNILSGNIHANHAASASYLSGMLNNPVLGWLGAALTVLGVALAVWARLYLGRNWGMPQSLKENPELVTTGPYSYIRHPIYTGVIVAMLGPALVIWWWLVLCVLMGVYFVYSARTEEQLMLAQFPNQYPEYMRRTRMLVPFLF